MAELKDFINSQIKIAEGDLHEIISKFGSRTVKKNRHLLKQGQTASEYIFVRKGALRIYFMAGVQEITGWFAFEREFFTELMSLKVQQPTKFNIQALEDTEVLTINYLAMESLYKTYPAWQEFGRKIWETAFQRVVAGILAYQTMTAQERYEQLLVQTNAVQRIPLKHLASFLGVTPTSLSRIRKSITTS